jgi:hypothetical protein
MKGHSRTPRRIYEYIIVLIILLSPRLNAEIADSTILGVFQTLRYLEDLYFNEHQTYALDLLTLKKALGVKDTIEFFVKRHELNIGIRDGKPLLSAIFENGDSIVQVGSDTLYKGAMNETDYCIDDKWRIKPNKMLIVLLHFDSNVDFNGEVNGGKAKLCSFMSKAGKSRRWKIEGCAQFASIDSDDSVPCVKMSLPAPLVRSGHWQVTLWPSSDVRITGKYLSDKSGFSYPIKGRISKEKPFSLFSKMKKGAVQ